jgi:hypothetical protein
LWRDEGPNWKDIAQSGSIGDCTLIAVAASIAYVDAGKIMEMMVDRRMSCLATSKHSGVYWPK